MIGMDASARQRRQILVSCVHAVPMVVSPGMGVGDSNAFLILALYHWHHCASRQLNL